MYRSTSTPLPAHRLPLAAKERPLFTAGFADHFIDNFTLFRDSRRRACVRYIFTSRVIAITHARTPEQWVGQRRHYRRRLRLQFIYLISALSADDIWKFLGRASYFTIRLAMPHLLTGPLFIGRDFILPGVVIKLPLPRPQTLLFVIDSTAPSAGRLFMHGSYAIIRLSFGVSRSQSKYQRRNSRIKLSFDVAVSRHTALAAYTHRAR